jgi:hypothetical protein
MQSTPAFTRNITQHQDDLLNNPQHLRFARRPLGRQLPHTDSRVHMWGRSEEFLAATVDNQARFANVELVAPLLILVRS